MFRTENPVADAERYYEEQEEAWMRQNESVHCECCGKACGAVPHFKLFGYQIACSEKCARKLLSEENVGDIVNDWLFDQRVEEEPEWWEDQK